MKELEKVLLLLKEDPAGQFTILSKSNKEKDRQKALSMFKNAFEQAGSPWGSKNGIQHFLGAQQKTVEKAIERLGIKNDWDNEYFPKLNERKRNQKLANLNPKAGNSNLQKFNEDRKNGDPAALAKSTNDFGKAFKINADAYKEQTGKSLEDAFKEMHPDSGFDELDDKSKKRHLRFFLKKEIENGNFKEVKHVEYTKQKKFGKENPNYQKPHTLEHKQKISQTVQKLKELKLWHSGFKGRNNLSFAEKFFLNFFKNNLDNMQQPINNRYEIGYWMDFAWEDGKVYIEVDGEQHYTEKGIAHDEKRTEELAAEGWTLLERIRWSDYKKKRTEKEKEDYLEGLLNKIKNKSRKFDIIVNDENKIKSGEVIKTIEQIGDKN